jgi:protein Mpv17
VIADQTIWSLYLNAMYSFFIGALAFRKPSVVWNDIKTTSWPALKTSWRFWPFVHCISFSHAVPLDLKLLWVDVMEIVWVTLLSRVANKDAAEGVQNHGSHSARTPTAHALLPLHIPCTFLTQ